MRFRSALPLAGLMLALAACSQNDEAEAPAPTPSLTTQAAPTVAADGTPLTVGQWQVTEDASGARAAFADAATAPVLTMACDRNARRLSLTRTASAPAPKTFRVEVSGLKGDVQMAPEAAGSSVLTAAIDQTQPIFHAFGEDGAVISISSPGEITLRVPGHVAIDRVIASCS